MIVIINKNFKLQEFEQSDKAKANSLQQKLQRRKGLIYNYYNKAWQRRIRYGYNK